MAARDFIVRGAILGLAAMVAACATPASHPISADACNVDAAQASVANGSASIQAKARGVGPGVLLIPSLGRGAEDFDALADALVRSGFRVIQFDPRWIGQSVGPEEATLFDLADDAALVTSALCGRPVDVVGHAFGNRVARAMATRHPEQVRSVTLFAAGGLAPPSEAVARALEGSASQGLKPDQARLDDLRTAFFAKGQDASVWLTGWTPNAALLQGAASRRTPRESWWGGGTAPILVVQAAEDPVAPPANAEALKAAAPDRVRRVTLAHASHAMLPEQPRALALVVRAWLRGERSEAKLQAIANASTVKPKSAD